RARARAGRRRRRARNRGPCAWADACREFHREARGDQRALSRPAPPPILAARAPHPPRAEFRMSLPLVVLAVLAVLVIGYFSYGAFVAPALGLDDRRVAPAHPVNGRVDFGRARP